jgi:hypothetical protein
MAKTWYRVDFIEGEKGRSHIGASEFEPPQLIERLKTDNYLMLSDLSYRDNQNRIVSWSKWDPRLLAIAYINPKCVTCVMPFAGDPRADTPASN